MSEAFAWFALLVTIVGVSMGSAQRANNIMKGRKFIINNAVYQCSKVMELKTE